MKWRALALLLRSAAFVHPEPERSALRALGDELSALERPLAPADRR